MNSYQRRKQEIRYWRERGEDLERIILDFSKRMKNAGIPLPLITGGVTADRILNDITSGEFMLRLEEKLRWGR